MAFPAPPRTFPKELSGQRIHLWAARLDPPAWRVEELARLIDPDERARAERFRFDVHRRRFIVGRGFMRIVVGAYLGVDPAGLVWSYGPKGKPYLAEPTAGAPLHFNLSNSEELALLGVNRVREIGVDVEHLRPLSDMEALAERFFSASESKTLLALPPELRSRGFFNCWTRKEAYLKAVGDGLSAPLDRFDVTLVPGEEPKMVTLEGDPERAARWSLYHLEPAQQYLGAVAIEEPGWELSAWRWEG